MIRYLLLLLTLTFCKVCSGQETRKNMVDFSTTVTGDFVANYSGGIKRGGTYIGKEDLTLGFNTGKAGWWQNGLFFFHALNTHGNGPSENLCGDLQVLSNIEAGDHTGLFEFWFRQQFGRFSFLIGQHEMSTEFIGAKYSGIFLNSSFGVMPVISLNMPVSIYPVAAPSIFIKYEADKNFIYRLGVYDGNPGNFEDNRYNLNWSLSAEQGFLTIGEMEYSQKDGEIETGNYKIGSYFHSGRFKDYTNTLKYKKGNYGIYMLVDKALFPRSFNASHGLSVFLQSGMTSSNCNIVQYYVGGGFRYHGILPNRFQDQLGIAISHISLSKNYISYNTMSPAYESALETTYVFYFGRRYSIQPSFQYIINPGSNKNLRNSLVGLLRFSLTY